MRTIPIFDATRRGVVGHLEAERETALALRRQTLEWFPAAARPLAPFAEAVNSWWLRRNASPYREEVFAMARLLGEPGVVSINTSYEWGCTTLGLANGQGGARLFRTLDWPFPGLGETAQVVAMRGRAGDYWNVTWPGAVGVLTAMAPGRFAAALNQAPLYRRTRGEWLRVADFALNGAKTLVSARDMPGIHLLRRVFDECETIGDAIDLLVATPIARPCIFTLVGCRADEVFVVEKEERSARVLRSPGATANAFRPGGHAGFWEPRPCGGTFREAASNNSERTTALDEAAPSSRSPFDWVRPPILNVFTRIAVEADPALGMLRVRGYEATAAGEPAQATIDFDLAERLAVAA
ncbi:hypothetical protein [Terrarubrum flagellatum]|uniref:hypothetical protein n=1 Tax=Terrirubrum flagellatum TaxID=2895980 RepID=UPI00314539CC